MATWEALVAVTGAIPKEMQPSYVRVVKEAVAMAREKERRKRAPGPLLVAGFCLPKALAPVLPIYLQGVLQVRSELGARAHMDCRSDRVEPRRAHCTDSAVICGICRLMWDRISTSSCSCA